MASAAVKARLKALRKKHGLGEFKKSRSTKTAGNSMARRKRSRGARRAPATRRTRRSSGRRSGGGWLPLSPKEMMLDFGIGAAVGPLSSFLAPYQAQYLGMFGQYSDEAALAIVGAVAHKYGSGLVKDGGKELFRIAVISAGQQTGASFLTGVSGSTSNAATNGWV